MEAELELATTTTDDPEAIALNQALGGEVDARSGTKLYRQRAPLPSDLGPPGGLLLIARRGGEAIGIAGIRHLDSEVAEVKSMYVAPGHRGDGVGRRLLRALEEVARSRGCRAVRLDTSHYLTEAVAFYRSAGYREIPDYNRNIDADMWFERSLEEG